MWIICFPILIFLVLLEKFWRKFICFTNLRYLIGENNVTIKSLSAQIFVTFGHFRLLGPTKKLGFSEFSYRVEISIKMTRYFSVGLLRSMPLQKWCANVYWNSVCSTITKQKQKGFDFILLYILYIIFHIDVQANVSV